MHVFYWATDSIPIIGQPNSFKDFNNIWFQRQNTLIASTSSTLLS